MRIAIIADIHGNLPALQAVIDDIARRGADRTINLGDCVSGPLWPRETLDLLEALALPTVRGNHDRWIAERPRETMFPSDAFAYDALLPRQQAWLGALPAHCEAAEGVVGVHGTPNDDNQYLLEEVVDGQLALSAGDAIDIRLGSLRSSVVLCAHSHLPRVVQAANGALIVNPGSVGCPAYIDPTPPAPHVSEAGSPHARYAMLSKSVGRWSVELIAIQYDWAAASRRADKNGRSEWARALATGFIRKATP
jgi:predicted phosphodiesterase